MSKDIKNILQEKFEGFEPQPTRNLWAGIEAEIQPKRRIAPVWWYAAAAAVAILLAVAFWPVRSVNQQSISPLANISDSLNSGQPEQIPAVTPTENIAEVNLPQKESQPAGISTDKSKKHQAQIKQDNPTRSFSTPVATEEVKARIQLATVDIPAPAPISVAQPAPVNLQLSVAQRPDPVKKNLINRELGLGDLDPETVVSLASGTLDELGVRSPVRYQLEKQEETKQKRSHFELILGPFSFSHTTHRDM